jgi:hypothetical protein
LSANQLAQTIFYCSQTPDQKFQMDKKQSLLTQQ